LGHVGASLSLGRGKLRKGWGAGDGQAAAGPEQGVPQEHEGLRRSQMETSPDPGQDLAQKPARPIPDPTQDPAHILPGPSLDPTQIPAGIQLRSH